MAEWLSVCRPMRRCEDAAVKDEILGSHSATIQSTSGEGFDLRDFRDMAIRKWIDNLMCGNRYAAFPYRGGSRRFGIFTTPIDRRINRIKT